LNVPGSVDLLNPSLYVCGLIQNEESGNPEALAAKKAAVLVRDISKIYHLWSSPTERFRFGLWSQVPAWAPIKLQNLAQKRKQQLGREFKALDNVSFDVRRGEVIGILGRNGSGKSTLLQVIAGTLSPTTGRVSVEGRITALLELGSGFNLEFTGRENVYLNASILGFTRQQTDGKLEAILRFSELADFIDQPVKTYSSGMAVRLAFAVQVLLDPQILIVDEALAVGDVFFQQKCYEHMRKLVDSGVSILIATHDFRAVFQFCDRALVLHEGSIVFAGDAVEAVKKFNYLVSPGPKSVKMEPSAKPLGETKTRFPDAELESPSPRRSEMPWPDTSLFSPLGPEQQDKDDLAECVRYSVLDEDGVSTSAFEYGEVANLFFEFVMHADFQIVSAGFTLKDRFGQSVHAKHAIQSGTFGSLPYARKNERIRCAAEVTLNVEPGQYTLGFVMMAIDMRRSDLDVRSSLDLVTFNACHHRVGSTKPVCIIDVGPRTSYTGLQLEHYGLANLPSKVRCVNVAD
jgi:lipopolysaccharide transport system ATP-binding protein